MRVFLHIGLHKTGTTTIQIFLNNISHILAEKGVSYIPSVAGEYNHHTLAARIRNTQDFNKTAAEVRQELENLRDLGMHTCVISSEVFAEHGIPVKLLPEMFKGNDLTVLAYLRRPDHQWASAYSQLVKEVDVRRCERIDEDPLPYDCGYFSILSKWMDVFKPGKLVLAPYDRPQWYGGKLILDFLVMLGVEPSIPGIDTFIGLNQNARLPAPLLETLRLTNESANLDVNEHVQFVSALESLAKAFPKAFGNSGIPFSSTLRTKAFEMLSPHLPVYRPYFRAGFDEGYLVSPEQPQRPHDS